MLIPLGGCVFGLVFSRWWTLLAAVQVGAELSRADPRPEVVGRVEAGVHVREEAVGAIPHARRLAEALCIPAVRAAVLDEATPEIELELELRHVAPEEERLHEDRR